MDRDMCAIARSLLSDKTGIVGPIMAIAALPVFGMVGATLDHGRHSSSAASVQSIVQEACDRANSTYFLSLPLDQRVAAADAVMQRRVVSSSDLSDVAFTAGIVGQQVQVAAMGTIDTTLAGLLGMQTLPIDIHLVCGDQPAAPGGPVCAILLHPDDKRALHVHEGEINAVGCEFHVKSTHKEAAVVHKDSTMHLATFCVAGEIINGPFIDAGASVDEYLDDGSSVISGMTLPDCVTVADPFAAMSVPPTTGCDFIDFETRSPVTNLRPGTYCGGITINANARINFRPGNYEIVDGPLNIDTGARVDGDDVTLILRGEKADILVKTAVINLRAPTTGPLAGKVVFQAHGAPSIEVKIDKSSQVSLAGDVYVPSGDVEIDESIVVPVVGERLTIHSSTLDVTESTLTLAIN